MSPARLGAVAGQELRSQLRGPLFWTLLALVALVTFTLNPTAMVPSGDVAVEGVLPFANSPHALAQTFALGGLFAYPFLVALVAGLVLVRDDEAGIGELLHSTPLTGGEYLLGKLAGVGGALALALLVHVALVVAVHGFDPGGVGPDRGPFRPGQIVLMALLFAAPGAWFTAVAAFVVGARTRRPLAVYAVPTVLFTLVVTVLWAWRPAEPATAWGGAVDRLLMLVDPSGLRWLSRTAFATDLGHAHFNTAPLPVDATLLANRLLTLALPAVLLWLAVRRFRPAADAGGGRRRPERAWAGPAWDRLRGRRRDARGFGAAPLPPPGAATSPAPRVPAPLALPAMTQRPPGTLAAALTLLRCELQELRRQPMVWLFVGFLMLVVAEAAQTGTDLYGTPTLLTAGTLAVRTLPVVTLLGCLFLLFTTVEAMHRERATGFHALLHSAPVSDGAILLGKGLAGGVLMALLTTACVVTGLGLLVLQPGGRVEVWPLLLVFGPVLLPTFLLWTAFVTAAGAVLRHRHGALAAGLAALVLTGFWYARGEMTWVTNWPLWSALGWTDMGVFPLHGRALLLNRLAALAGAAFLFAVARRAFPRTEGDAAHDGRGAAVLRVALRLAPVALLPILVTGFLAIQVRTGYQGEAVSRAYREYHRENAATWRNAAPPEITAVDLALDLQPEARRLEVEGRFRITNPGDEPMRWLPFTVTPSLGPVAWELDGAAVAAEERAGLHLLPLPEPLEPGGGATVGFAYAMTYPRGLSRNGGGAESFILPAGVQLSTHRGEMLPVPGYVDGLGLPAAERPRPARLPDGTAPPPPDGPFAGRSPAFVSRLRVTAPSGYVVSATGDRVAAWSAGGRTTTVWRSDVPVHTLGLHAGPWEERRRDGAAVLFHPGHARNVDVLLDALVAARRHYSEWFLPYPWEELRLGEVPDLHTNATAFPTHVAFSEGIGFLAGGDPAAGLPFSVAAHEAAHQWWGHLVTAGDGPGDGWLIEGMAHYSTLLLHDAVHGDQARTAFARQLERVYLERRGPAERPLLGALEATPGEEAVLSQRGAWMLWMLHRQVGREAMLATLGDLAARHAASRRHLTPAALLAALRDRAPDPTRFDAFVAAWLAGTALPEYRLTDAALARTPTGWRAAATLTNAGTGTAGVEVAAVGGGGPVGEEASEDAAANPPGEGDGARRTVELDPGASARLVFDLPFRPERLVVDPQAHVLQRNRDRAVAELPRADRGS